MVVVTQKDVQMNAWLVRAKSFPQCFFASIYCVSSRENLGKVVETSPDRS